MTPVGYHSNSDFVISNKIDSSIEISIIRPNQPIIKVCVVSQSQTATSIQDKATR